MVDLTFLKKFTKGDTQKMKRYITLYLDVAPKTFEKMQHNLNDGDWEQLRIYAHSLKPQADFMGTNSLKEALNRIEEAVNSKNVDVLESLFKAMLAVANDTEKSLKAVLDDL